MNVPHSAAGHEPHGSPPTRPATPPRLHGSVRRKPTVTITVTASLRRLKLPAMPKMLGRASPVWALLLLRLLKRALRPDSGQSGAERAKKRSGAQRPFSCDWALVRLAHPRSATARHSFDSMKAALIQTCGTPHRHGPHNAGHWNLPPRTTTPIEPLFISTVQYA